jgi:hypothetical protein
MLTWHGEDVACSVFPRMHTCRVQPRSQVATKDRRLGDMGLQEIYDHEDTFAEARGAGEQGNENGECYVGKQWGKC